MISTLLYSTILATPLDKHLLYFVLVDRFANGQTENDNQIDTADPQAFHGGDLWGLAEKIPHLKSMGVDSVWISPIFTMRTEKFIGHGAFHGYWIQNLDTIETRFGGERALRNVSKKLQDEDISLVMDMVYNHVSFDSPLVNQKPSWFHPAKPISDWNDEFELQNYQVHGLPDLDQANEEVYRYLYQKSISWQKEANLSGFRIDAIRHMNNDFLAKISEDLHNNIGKNFWLLGEDFQGNPISLANRANETKVDALFDFPLYYAMTNVFCDQKSAQDLGVILSSDREYPENFQWVTFLDNHDLPRIHSRCKSPEDVQQALLFQFSVRGLPMITYGFEAEMKGQHEPMNRGSIDWEKPFPLAKTIRDYRDLRAKFPVLEKGLGEVIQADKKQFVYRQSLKKQHAYVAVNQSEKAMVVSLPKRAKELAVVSTSQEETPLAVVPPKSTKLIIVKHKCSPKSTFHTVKFQLSSKIEDEIRIVGSATEIGGWDPSNGVTLQKECPTCPRKAEVVVPKSAVIAWKLVYIKEGSVEWEQQENRILWNQKNVDIALPGQ